MFSRVSYLLPRRITKGAMVALAIWMAVPSARAEGQDRAVLQAEPDSEARLRRWLAVRAERGARRWAGGLAIANGALASGAAAAIRLASDAPEGEWASVALVGVGLLSLAQGVALLLLPDRAAEDLRALPARPLTEREIGRLEGIFELDARRAGDRRRRAVLGGIGLTLAAGVGVPVLASSDVGSERGRGIGYGILGGLCVTGLVYLVSALFESAEEADWREYQQGLAPVARRVRLHGLGVAF